jgi:hypothetical protein
MTLTLPEIYPLEPEKMAPHPALVDHFNKTAERVKAAEEAARYQAVEDQNRVAAESKLAALNDLYKPTTVEMKVSAFALRMRRERNAFRAMMWVMVVAFMIVCAIVVAQKATIHDLEAVITHVSTPAVQVAPADPAKVRTLEDGRKVEAPMKGQTTKGFSEATR